MIKHITITNFCGIEEVKIDCKKFNIFQGQSLQGKTSILEAIKWAFIGGDDDSIVRNGVSSCEVVLISDNGTRIERRLSRGGKNKLFAYKNDAPIDNPQKVLAKIYHPMLFGPTEMIRMKPKELSEFISDAIGKRLKFNDEQISKYGLKEVDLTEDPIAAIQKLHKTKYDQRTEANRAVKTMTAKASGAIIKVTQEEVDTLDKEVDQLRKELDTAKENNAKIEIGKRNADAKKRTEENITILKKEIEDIEKDGLNLEQLTKDLATKKKTLIDVTAQVNTDRSQHSVINDTLKKLESGKVQCPIHGDIICTTDMSPYKDNLKKSLETIKTEGKARFEQTQLLEKEVEAMQIQIETLKNLENKRLQLSRAESLLGEIEIFSGESVDVTSLEKKYKEKSEELSKMKVGLELSKVSGLEDMQKRAESLDQEVKSLDELLNTVIPGMLTLNVKNVTMTKEGLYFKGVPLYREGDSAKLRICTAILKDLFPHSNIFHLDRLECIDQVELEKYVNYYAKETNGIQYFSTYVGEIKFAPNPNVRLFTIKSFKVA